MEFVCVFERLWILQYTSQAVWEFQNNIITQRFSSEIRYVNLNSGNHSQTAPSLYSMIQI